ncbi:MAG TPA: GGDEF domain-containing protein, partial [Rhodoglobus sp.]|nr:GGDEF domain-containing protein [Rhodoglobus sp.]
DGTVGVAEAMLGLADDAVDTIAVDLGTHVDALADTMGVHLGESLDFAGLLAHARDQMVRTSMQLVEETMQQHHVIADLEHEREELRRDARTDRLTNLANRAAFDEVLAGVVDDRINGRTLTGGLGIAMIDIDHFKKFNDTYGHRVGDTVLSAVGAALSNATRANETIARYGGEEFVLVIPIVDSPDALHAAAERIRQTIEAVRIEADGLALNVTVSVGAIAATSVLSPQAGPTLVEAADRLLYQAKDGGRNTVRTDFVG